MASQSNAQAVEQQGPETPEVAQPPARARVAGERLTRLPDDLYIPPDALEVFLDAFEGPLDLLLYLIKRQNLDIRDIPIADITRQYMDYVELMREVRLELAAEYLVMAAYLGEIKSRVLLPRPVVEDEEEGDPRADLIRRLQEYERFRQAAEDIDALPRMGRELLPIAPPVVDYRVPRPEPTVDLREVLLALQGVLKRADLTRSHQVQREALSVRERMSRVLEAVRDGAMVELTRLFSPQEGRAGVVVSFLAILELTKQHLIELVQTRAFGPIHVRAAVETEAGE
jgi:segregation and condensation protein A